MPNCIKFYKNEEKAINYKRRNRRRYYNRNTENCYRKGAKWTLEEMKFIMDNVLTDYELSMEMGRSIQAIQLERNRIRKGEIPEWEATLKEQN